MPIIQEALSQRPRDEWIPLLRGQGQWVVPVRNFEEVCTDDTNLSDNGLLHELEHPQMGATTVFGLPVKLSETPFTSRQHAPLHGEHTVEVLQELGYSGEEIGKLQQAKIVEG